MTALLVEPPSLFEGPLGAPEAEACDDGEGGGPTLDEVLSGAWEGLAAHAAVACPVCAGEMRPRYGSSPAPVGGSCRECATTYS